MKNILFSLVLLGIVLLSACRKDFSTQVSTGQLEFSKDTVFLDTVFSTTSSSTYALKVYNRSKNDISIPSIELGRGSDSGYRLNVDGVPGKSFENIDILAKDSIYVFVETTIDYDEITSPLYEDDLLFDSGANEQVVKLVTLVQDAHFLFPDKVNGVIETIFLDGEDTEIQGRFLTDDELTFTNEKPYVIYGYMMIGTEIDEAKTLTIEAGANVHFHENSGLYVNVNSSLHVLGTRNIDGQAQTEVIFQGDRLEPEFENVPGQWGFISLFPTSVNNIINYATIKNGTVGVISQGIENITTPVLEITNTQIYNQSLFGILGIHTNIVGSNLAINEAGIAAIAGTAGGVYNFTHCTFANSWSPRSTPNLLLLDSNRLTKSEDSELFIADISEFNFTNCIITGSNNIELEFIQDGNMEFNFNFTNNTLDFNDVNNIYTDDPFYDFTDVTHYHDNILNADHDFKNLQLNELIIGENSDCVGQASVSGTTQVPLDILGKTRGNPADIGAYEHIIFGE